MNDIRKSNEEEIELVRATFNKHTIGALLCFFWPFIFATISLAILIPIGIYVEHGPTYSIPYGLFCLVITLVFGIRGICTFVHMNKNEFVVTNKRIYGKYVIVTSNTFSIRLDEIDICNLTTFLKMNSIFIRFSMGNRYVNGTNMSSRCVRFIDNCNEIVTKINEMMKDVKNAFDVEVDIKMEGLKTENRKADALEKIGDNISSHSSKASNTNEDYIDELERLKRLCDKGIITQKEFEKEKEEILANNHKTSS